MSRTLILGAAMACALGIAACGSHGRSSTSSTSARSATQGLRYARCMRSHGVSNFPDPSSNGSVSYHGSTSSPAFTSAHTACADLEPRKVVRNSGQESSRQAAQEHAQLIRWAKCMRHQGYPEMPDPKIGTPQPTPGYGTVLGWGAAYVEIPDAYDAHSQAFLNTSEHCGINPSSNPRH